MSGRPARFAALLARRWRLLALLVVGGLAFPPAAVAANYWWVGRNSSHIEALDGMPANGDLVGIVFGGGIVQGQPKPLIADRLDAGVRLLAAGKVRKLVVSGDNRFQNYDEPAAMRDYLIRKGVSPALIQEDKAGRSTYETCDRAHRVFGLDRAVLISESAHLPRAIYTCRHLGVDAVGFSSDGPALTRFPEVRRGQALREVLARAKATFNLYVRGERTVLGEQIPV
ncbi:MAG: SanA/YdcF family protein [Sporichthyaceae bacterium]